ncbi:MAG: hypothetical protein E7057_05095 [Lentisphaerae bacterium]|nr:hypothetical protein [Lentisphaerota bacterium]
MEMLAKYIRMRTARSAATASHPSVEHATEGIKKKNPADVTPLGFCQAFLKSVDQAATAERRDNPLSLPSFLSRERKRSGASAFGTLSGRSRLIARPPLILATFVASALLAWKCSQSTFACGLRARRQPPRTRALNMPLRASKRKTLRMLLHLGFAKLFSKAFFGFALWSMPRLAGVARAVTYIVCSFACSLQNPALPHTAVPKIKRSSRDSGAARQFTFFAKLSFLRKKAEWGECLWHSFRSLAAYCSSSAHPRNICCVGFARMEMLAKYIRMRTARSAATASHPCVEHATEGIKKKNPADVTPLGFCQAFLKSVFWLCIMVNAAPCGRRSRSHIHSMLLCLLLAKPGIAAYCCAKNKTIKPRQRSGTTIRFLCQAFFLAKEKSSGRSSTEFFAKLFFKKASIKPRQRSGATIRFLCQAFFLAKESGFARMEMLAKYIRMRTARSAATASHPSVEHATEGINQYREQSQTEMPVAVRR